VLLEIAVKFIQQLRSGEPCFGPFIGATILEIVPEIQLNGSVLHHNLSGRAVNYLVKHLAQAEGLGATVSLHEAALDGYAA